MSHSKVLSENKWKLFDSNKKLNHHCIKGVRAHFIGRIENLITFLAFSGFTGILQWVYDEFSDGVLRWSSSEGVFKCNFLISPKEFLQLNFAMKFVKWIFTMEFPMRTEACGEVNSDEPALRKRRWGFTRINNRHSTTLSMVTIGPFTG